MQEKRESMGLQTNAKKAGESGWRETIKIIVHALILAMIVRIFFYQPFNIPSGSMKQTLLVGDYLFVSKLAYGYSRYSFPWGVVPFKGRVFGGEPKRGDVVVFKLPATTPPTSSSASSACPETRSPCAAASSTSTARRCRRCARAISSRRRRTGRSRASRRRCRTGSKYIVLDSIPNSEFDNTDTIRCRPATIS
jgi:signal peptidase I